MRNYEDSYRHKGLRKKLLDSLRDKGITDENVLAAMMNIPRHFFLDTALEHIAYQDRAFPIGEGQTISQPYTVAYQTQLLEVSPTSKNSGNRNRKRLPGNGSGRNGCFGFHY